MEQNMIVANTLLCQLLTSSIAIPLDLIGVTTNGLYLSTVVCPFLAFIHTMFGKINKSILAKAHGLFTASL